MTSARSAQPGGWTDKELATLAAVAETFVRGDALRRARLAADALAVADPTQVSQLRLALRLFDSRPANLLLARQWGSFITMSPAERERYLHRWARSPLALRRSAFHALRKLLTFLAYADPGGDVPNARLEALGYRPDRPGVTNRPTPIRPFRPDDPGDGPVVLDADVVVVGSGAGGGVVAADLAVAGMDVVVLEAGPFVPEPEMPLDELTAFERLYLDHGLLATWDGSVTMLAGGAVGGGTLVNWMTCLPTPHAIRAEWSREHGIDGIVDAAWDADMDVLERELGVTATVPAIVGPKDDRLIAGAEALGWDAAPTRRNARECHACGSCAFGCRAGAKQSGIRAHLATASSHGARIVAETPVDRVLLRAGRVAGVAGRVKLSDGIQRDLMVNTNRVVLAAGGLRTPAILGRSGIANPAIGRHLRIHPTGVVAGIFGDPIEMWRGPMQGARSLEFATADPATGRNGYAVESAPGHPGLLALALPWDGTDAHASILRAAAAIAPLIAVIRDGGQGRVTIGRSGRARIEYRLDAGGVATLRHAMGSMARIAREAGARQVVAAATPSIAYERRDAAAGDEARFSVFLDRLAAMDFGPNRGHVFSAHQLGTVRAGASAAEHPCDPRGRVRADASGAPVPGLYVADGSLFPTAIGVNPMLTIMALARRVARTVAGERAGG
ncbi:MAG TPA: GMC family oxidoreductase N-terminal domain-containing protein [Candidatus Limnocylindrales bacterium]